MDRAPCDTRKLVDIPSHVVAVRVEPRSLPQRAEHAVGSRVRAGARDPLPVHLVVRDVPVDQQGQEVPGAGAPVEVEVAHQERRDDQAGAVVHPSLAPQLSHPRVDDRVAGAARAPGVERLVVVAPVVPAVGVVRPRRRGAAGQHLVVVVAPADLADERVDTGPAAVGPRDDLGGRHAAQVQVGRQPRRAVAGEVVVPVVIGRDAVRQPAVQQCTPRRLAAVGQVRRQLAVDQVTDRGRRADLQRRRARHAVRNIGRRAVRDVAPTPPVRGEALVVPAGRREDVAGRDHRHARVGHHVDGERITQLLEPSTRVPGDVIGHVHRVGGDVGDHGSDRVDHVTPPREQRAAQVPQARRQVAHAGDQERHFVRRGDPRGQDRVVEDEQRHDAVRFGAGGGERRVVVHPQIPGEQDDDRGHDDLSGWGPVAYPSDRAAYSGPRREASQP